MTQDDRMINRALKHRWVRIALLVSVSLLWMYVGAMVARNLTGG